MTPDAPHNDRVLILGIGNILWADEGFGVRCVETLGARHSFDDRVRLLDGGTQGIYLVNQLEDVDHLIIFDAIDYGLPPGSLKIVRDREVPQFLGAKKMSLHQVGFQEVLAMADLLGQLPANLLLIGVQPEQLDDYGGSLSPAVKSMIEPALSEALGYLADSGIHPLENHLASAEIMDAHPHAALRLGDYEHGRPSQAAAWRHGDARFLTPSV
ncbi:HyaD/HybD family hydrogenase maturation endopeptidase [Thiorhodovibrio frisius]|uniref:Hydrogenase expression/formation protein n=1 Tax=Thiorhodovibrio frisius TaxID=631362 RepID=H8Z5R5_9GAMM|nr:HyaD/HybD family hydrogenase maturation endopeptidase [Thiorhodovibrio frisius]EIC19549.1 hydrogenase expression/formation protein [Thiorhodovibrio frisius]WPL20489.1 Hydrogenase 2 maturation protease [Thiorhodovibrio frisius]